jgi:hypothetical protein
MNFVWSKPLDSDDLKMCALETHVPAQCKGRLPIANQIRGKLANEIRVKAGRWI